MSISERRGGGALLIDMRVKNVAKGGGVLCID